jgi:ABC-type glycerol-3-phosphate transport system permease component
MWRMLFWAAPLYLLVIPISLLVIPEYLSLTKTIHNLLHQMFLTISAGMVEIYIYIFDDFFYKKKFLNAIKKSTEIELS